MTGPKPKQPARQPARQPAKRLADLGVLRDALQQRALEAAQHSASEQAALREQQRRQQAQQEQFARAVGPVQRLRERGTAELQTPRPLPHPRMRELDEAAALAESLSDEVNLESLLLTDDGLSFRRPGIGQDVVAKLRRGHWALQGQIDLHGCTREQARQQLGDFIRNCQRSGKRCLRVVHGKGLGSPGRQPVLKDKVQRWLAQSADVIAFAQASGPQGGAGALLVLLAGAAAR